MGTDMAPRCPRQRSPNSSDARKLTTTGAGIIATKPRNNETANRDGVSTMAFSGSASRMSADSAMRLDVGGMRAALREDAVATSGFDLASAVMRAGLPPDSSDEGSYVDDLRGAALRLLVDHVLGPDAGTATRLAAEAVRDRRGPVALSTLLAMGADVNAVVDGDGTTMLHTVRADVARVLLGSPSSSLARTCQRPAASFRFTPSCGAAVSLWTLSQRLPPPALTFTPWTAGAALPCTRRSSGAQ